MAADQGDRVALVVEDDPDVAYLMSHYLRRAGWQVVVVDTAAGAPPMVASLLPDVVLLDLVLPDGSGHDVAAALSADPALRDVPVIVVSILDAADYPSGIVASLPKPFSGRRLLELVESVVAPAAP